MSEIEQEVTTKRRMPEPLKRFLLRVQGGKVYLPAAYRLVWFRDECPDWGVETFIHEGGQEAGFVTVQARITNESGRIIASAHKTETRQDFPAGWVEKAETGAIARALAIAGFGTQFSDDMDEGRLANAPQSRMPAIAPNSHSQAGVWEGPGQCPTCHAPAGKLHGKACLA